MSVDLPEPRRLELAAASDRHRYLRLLGYFCEHCLNDPQGIAWFVANDAGGWNSVDRRTVLAAVCVVHRWLVEDGVTPGAIVLSQLNSSLSWAAIELAASAADAVHAAIDPRCGNRQFEAIRAAYGNPAAEFSWTAPLSRVGRRDADPPLTPRPIDDASLIRRADRFATDCPSDLREFAVRQVRRFRAPQPGGTQDRDRMVPDHRPAALLHTSGSIAEPKAVLLSHDNLLSNAIGKLDAMPQTAADVRLNVLPFAHAYARTCELGTWAVSGGALACLERPTDLAAAAEALRPTLLNATPLVWDRIRLEMPTSRGSGSLLGDRLRMIASGGAGLSDETFAAFAAIGLPLHQGYGLTETSPVVCSNRVGETVENDIGRPITGVRLRLADDGQLWVAGPNLMLGYWDAGRIDQEATVARLRDGYFATGDLAVVDGRGRLRIVGRVDDRINLPSGYKVDPSPVEQMLLRIEGVSDAFVFMRGARLVAVLSIDQLRNPAESLRAAVGGAVESLPSYGRPTEVYFAASLPPELLGCRGPKGGWRREAAARVFDGLTDRFERFELRR